MKSIKIIKTVRDTQTGELLSPPNIVEREDKRAQAFVNGGFAAYVKTAPSPKKAEPTVSEAEPKKEEPKKAEPTVSEPKKEEPKKEEPKKETKPPSKKRKRTSVTSSPSPKIKK